MAHINLSLINSFSINSILVFVGVLNSCWQMSGNTAVVMNLALLYHFYLIHFLNDISQFMGSSGMFKSTVYVADTAQNMPTS